MWLRVSWFFVIMNITFSSLFLFSKRKNKRRSPTNTLVKSTQKPSLSNQHTSEEQIEDYNKTHGNDLIDAGIINSSVDEDDDDEKSDFKKRWISRIMSIAVPVQLAIITIFCVCCIFEPHCCDSLNNFSMSFSPQLRYIKGPPPVWLEAFFSWVLLIPCLFVNRHCNCSGKFNRFPFLCNKS